MTNSDIVNRFVSAWATLNIDAFMPFLGEAAVYHNMPLMPLAGHAAIREFFGDFLRDVARASFEVIHSAQSAAGTVLNERVDTFVLENGKTVRLEVAGVFEVVDGKITAWRDYFDLKSFQAQRAA